MSLESSSSLGALRRSAAQLLACVVLDLFPDAVLVTGGETDLGFFYDFIFPQAFPQQALHLVETNMKALIKQKPELRSLSMMRENARDYFHIKQQPILAEQAALEDKNVISLLQIGEFWGLTPAPHLEDLEEIRGLRLLEASAQKRYIAEEEIEVVRITGAVFFDFAALKTFNKAYDSLKKYDHRLLGPELNLFSFIEEVSEIECIWHPKGEQIRQTLIGWWKKQSDAQDTQSISTPALIKPAPLAFAPALPSVEIDCQKYILNTDSFAQHIQFFRKQLSASVLPVRLAECKAVYRQEDPVLLWGLLRGRSYTTDLTTIYCSEEQLLKELISSLLFIQQTIRILDFEAQWIFKIPMESKGKQSSQQKMVDKFTQALDDCNIAYLSERRPKESNRFAPRIELRLTDNLGREWQGPALESFQLPEMPIVLAQTAFGSLDRLIALLIEKTQGKLPLWLAPEQIRVLSVGKQASFYAADVVTHLKQRGFKAQLDASDEKLGMKIHTAEKEKIPYILIIGEKEWNKKLVTIRSDRQKSKSQIVHLDEFIKMFEEEVLKEKVGGS